MADDLDGRGVVVDDDGEVFRAAGRSIEQDERESLLAQPRDRIVGHLRGRDEQAVDLSLAEDTQVARLALRLVIRVAQDDVVAPLEGRVLGALDD